MKKLALHISLFLLCLICSNCSNPPEKQEETQTETAPPISSAVTVIKKPDLMKLISQKSGRLKIINFWATWCAPCVKEIPYFEKIVENFPSDRVEVLLVSLDFKKDLENKVIPFVNKRGLKSKVFLLDETDYNSWIDDVSTEWQEDIPATLFVYPEKGIRSFSAKEYSQEELMEEVKGVIK